MSPNIKVKGRQKSCCWWCLNMTAVHLHVSWGTRSVHGGFSVHELPHERLLKRMTWHWQPLALRDLISLVLPEMCWLAMPHLCEITFSPEAQPLYSELLGDDSSPLVTMCWTSSFCSLTGQSQHLISQHKRWQNQLINSVLKSKINRCKLAKIIAEDRRQNYFICCGYH